VKRIKLAKPQISKKEQKAVIRVLKSGILAQGPEVRKFEEEFSKIVGNRDCVAVNSGTSALHLCLISLGIGPGDQVIVPSFTFAATANVVALVGATPIFVDINPNTYCIDPQQINNAITKNTKAIIAVHLYGLPAAMYEIQKIAEKHSLLLIEDAAQAHLSKIGNQAVGTFGHAAAFSFYPTKNMTSGEGGMIVSSNSEMTRKCRLLRNQGMEIRYKNEIPGYNLRMTDIHAAIGIEQLKKLPEMTEKRIQNAAYLDRYIDEVTKPTVPDGYKHVFHQYTIRIRNNRTLISAALRDVGIENDVYYPIGVHQLQSFQSDLILEETELASKEVLSIPVHPNLSRRELAYIAKNLNQLVRGLPNR
jgi:perosamine synthetase